VTLSDGLQGPAGRRQGGRNGHILTAVSFPTSVLGALLLALLALALAACGQARGAVPVAAALPLDMATVLADQMPCGGAGVAIIRTERVDFTGDGVPDAVVAARCDVGAGNPPSAVFAVAAGPGGAAEPQRLLDPARGNVLKDIRAKGTDVDVVTFGYSRGVPRCCPDLEITARFRWDGARVVPGAVTRAPLVLAG
jgi:hypothetical protein